MKTLASELGPHAERISNRPRVYVDANLPARVVGFMRGRLRWDVLFVMEHDDLRRARDGEHFRLARQLRRTLLSLDRDYFDDRRFPPDQSGGVIVVSAPHEAGLLRILRRIDRVIFRPGGEAPDASLDTPPLAGRKLHAHLDWEDGRPA